MFSGVGAAVPNGADPIDAEEEARRLGISGPITTSLFKRWNTSARRLGLRMSAARKNEAPNNELVQVWVKLDAAARRFMALVEETYPPDRGKSPGNVRSAVCWGRCGGPMRSAVCWGGRCGGPRAVTRRRVRESECE